MKIGDKVSLRDGNLVAEIVTIEKYSIVVKDANGNYFRVSGIYVQED